MSATSIHIKTYPRAGLIGNPSDGFFGKTIAFTFDNFQVSLVLSACEKLALQSGKSDSIFFDNYSALLRHIKKNGHCKNSWLLTASVKMFYEYCSANGLFVGASNFDIRFQSTIPYQVGFAGSSAIIIACLRALMAFFHIEIPPHNLANLALSVETEELNIAGGLQDRVAQVYQGLMYMDFNRELMQERGYGQYEKLDQKNISHLFIAYRRSATEGSAIFHHNLRERFQNNEAEVIAAIECWKTITDEAKSLINQRQMQKLGALMNLNFDRRASLYQINPHDLKMIETARSQGAAAKFTGSGGAIIGIVKDEAEYKNVASSLQGLDVEVFEPRIISSMQSSHSSS